GTGAISILFHSFPYGASSKPMQVITLAFFFFSLVLFVLFTALSAARYVLFRGIWQRMLRHPVQSLYLGTFPMGATSLLTIAVSDIYATYSIGGRPFLYVIWALWWINGLLSLSCCLGMLHVMITRQAHSLESMTLSWLLPVVTLIVEATAGGTIALTLVAYSLKGAFLTLIISACMIAVGLALTFMFLTIYLLRLLVYGYPLGSSILSTFLPLGPAGQGAYAVILIGSGCRSVLPLYGNADGVLGTSVTGEIINVVCVAIAAILWAFGTTWIAFAFLSLSYSVRQTRIPFQLTFWSMIFPNGVYANATIALAATLSSKVLRVWGAIYAFGTLLLWIYIAVRTVQLMHFTPAWHTIVMGTGVTSALIHNFPYGSNSATRIVTLILFFFNLLLFTAISGATFLRYIMFPDLWMKMLHHPAQSLFVGAMPMGFATLINIALDMNQETGIGGQGFLYFLWGCWSSYQEHSFSKMAAVWLLPVVTLIVVSSTGGLLAAALRTQSPRLSLASTAISFTMVIIGLSLAIMMITVYFARLILYGPPDANLILSAFIVLGPLGQGGYSLLQCGIPPFGLAYWGLIFPNGVYALLSVQLGVVLNSHFFYVFGALWSCVVFLLWITILTRTVPAFIDRSIFNAPCLAATPAMPSTDDVEQGGEGSSCMAGSSPRERSLAAPKNE
ncbi:voltage-dependent anion channel, partial [Phlebopus sp. FC_14]